MTNNNICEMGKDQHEKIISGTSIGEKGVKERKMKTANVNQSEAVPMRSSASRCELVLCSSSSGKV